MFLHINKFFIIRHERSYQGYCTRSRPIAEVKLLRARLVIRWVTTCEARVLFVLIFFNFLLNTFTDIFYEIDYC